VEEQFKPRILKSFNPATQELHRDLAAIIRTTAQMQSKKIKTQLDCSIEEMRIRYRRDNAVDYVLLCFSLKCARLELPHVLETEARSNKLKIRKSPLGADHLTHAACCALVVMKRGPALSTVLACRMRTAGGNNLWRKEEIPAGKQVSEEIHQAHGLRLTPKKSRRTEVKSDQGKRKSRSQRS
jgi:hypothetical protein